MWRLHVDRPRQLEVSKFGLYVHRDLLPVLSRPGAQHGLLCSSEGAPGPGCCVELRLEMATGTQLPKGVQIRLGTLQRALGDPLEYIDEPEDGSDPQARNPMLGIVSMATDCFAYYGT